MVSEQRSRFCGKVAVVTGAAGGIGAACARLLAKEGARLALADLKTPDSLASEHLALPCDVSSAEAVEDFCERVVERFGRFDVLVNVAGAMIYRPIEALSARDWLESFSVNLFGAAYFTTQAFRRMGAGGAIVNISSVHAMATTELVAPYAAAKAALLSLTRSSAIEGMARDIRVNAIAPGAIDTPMLRESPAIKAGIEVLAARYVGQPDNVAATAAFLASAEAAFITGACVNVDGGRLARL